MAAGLPPDAVMAVVGNGDILYRLVRLDQPVVEAFTPRASRGRGRAPRGPVILHVGLSMFSSASAAASRGGKYRSMIAEVTLPRDPDIHVAKTFGAEHYTVWGDPAILAGSARDTGQRT